MRKLIIALFAVLMMASLAAAEMPGGLKIGDQNLQLNGHGIRTKYFFKVYDGGLYLPQAGQSDAQAIIQADEPMAIRMQWLRNVPADKLIDGWNSGFSHATKGNPGALQSKIDRFNSIFEQGAQKNDVHEIVYMPENGVAIFKNGKLAEQIEGKDFKEAVFSIWLGDKTEVPDLRDKMLGQ